MAEFIPGKELCRRFYFECVQGLLAKKFPNLKYSAGLIGYGSEVLGFDTPMSRDHDWGPRMSIFLAENEVDQYASVIRNYLAEELPYTFYGYSTNFGAPNLEDNGTRHLEMKESGLVDHRIDVSNLRHSLNGYLPVDVFGEMSAVDWLLIPQQKLRTIVKGDCYHDDLDSLKPIQKKLSWYPEDVFVYQLASIWSRIGQEEHLMGRCGYVGDEVGSSLLGASLSRVLMQLGFLLEQQYAPYPKWFGTGFTQLEIAEKMLPALHVIRTADTWQERESGLCSVYKTMIQQMNSLNLIPAVPVETVEFFGRPFQVVYGGKIAEALKKLLVDTSLVEAPLIGSVDIFSASTDITENNFVCAAMKAIYE